MVDLQTLLGAVCDKHWAGGGGTDSGIYIYTRDYTLRWEPTDSDIGNAHWIVWCLDRLEELGWIVQIENFHLNDCEFPFFCNWRKGKNVAHEPDDYCFASTRAEAVTNALAAALGIDGTEPPQTERDAVEETETGEGGKK